MKKIYYVRHGESEANVSGVTAGSELDSPLTEKGREQAKRVGKDLKDKNIELIVCSTMHRARETAEIIAKTIGYDTSKIMENKLFIERGVGIYFDMPYTKYREDIANDKLHQSVETTEAMHKRVKDALDWLKTLKPQTIALVSHGATGRMLKIIRENLHHSDIYEIDGFENSEIYEFELD